MEQRSQIEIWVTEANQGDSLAVAKLLAAYHPILRSRAAARMDHALKARCEPEDILQQVYLQVIRELGRFEDRGPDSFLNWVMTILDRRLIDAHRAATAQVRDVAREAAAPGDSYWNLLDQLYADTSTASRVARRDEAVGALLGCLSVLSDAHRQVLELRFLQGLPVSEVASRLDRSEAAVVALSKRALDALRKSMDHLGEFTRGG
ncbi:MAG: RNA polymerase sigma factor [Planctomycetota bacterium]|jgi:RNA polymerase sigma-70 factor (ECF subfamily)